MKLFIFKPSKHWNYCGGMVMATANTYEEACQRIQAKQTADDLANEWQPEQLLFRLQDNEVAPTLIRERNVWILFKEVELAPIPNPDDINGIFVPEYPSICEIEYNYA